MYKVRKKPKNDPMKLTDLNLFILYGSFFEIDIISSA